MSQMNEYKHSKLVVNVLDFIISLLSSKAGSAEQCWYTNWASYK